MSLSRSRGAGLHIFLAIQWMALHFDDVVAQEACVESCVEVASVESRVMLQTQSASERTASHELVTNGFDLDKPEGRIVDINIGTNFSPMPKQEGNFLLLVDPLPDVCSSLSGKFKSDTDVAVLCCAISNYTGSATFLRYNNKGVSSSLVPTMKGTSHERFSIKSKDTVIVLEAAEVLGGLVQKKNKIQRLKTDMQGFDLTTLQNLQPLLQTQGQIMYIKSECFYDIEGKQIYQGIENSCQKMVAYLQNLGYVTKIKDNMSKDAADVQAYKPPATDFIDERMWANQIPA